MQRGTELHAHLAIIHGNVHPRALKGKNSSDAKGMTLADADAFLCSTSFVTCWHSKSHNVKVKRKKRNAAMDQQMESMGINAGFMSQLFCALSSFVVIVFADRCCCSGRWPTTRESEPDCAADAESAHSRRVLRTPASGTRVRVRVR